MTFSIAGVGKDVPPDTIVLTVDGMNYRMADLPISFTWAIGSMHVYQWAEVVPSTTEGRRYAWLSTTGILPEMKGVIFVPEGGGTILAEYKTQYLWVINIEGIGQDALPKVFVDGAFIVVFPFYSWWDEGSQHVVCFEEYITSANGYKRYASHDAGCTNLRVTEPGVLNRVYHVEYLVYIWAGRGKGTTNPPPGEYWIDNGTHIHVTAIPEQGYVFEEWSDIYKVCSTYERYSNPTKLIICGQISLRANFREVKPFDFSVHVEPSIIQVYKSGSAVVGIVVLGEGEPPQSVFLSISNLPKGVTYTIGAESITPPLSTTLTLMVSPEAPSGVYTLVLTATSGNITKNYFITLAILEYGKYWYEQPLILIIVGIAVLVITISVLLYLRRK